MVDFLMIIAYFIGGPLDQTKMLLQENVIYFNHMVSREPIPAPRYASAVPPPRPVMCDVNQYRRLGRMPKNQGDMEVYVFVEQ